MYKSEKPNEVIPREPCYRKSDGRMNKAEFIRSPAEPRFQREKKIRSWSSAESMNAIITIGIIKSRSLTKFSFEILKWIQLKSTQLTSKTPTMDEIYELEIFYKVKNTL